MRRIYALLGPCDQKRIFRSVEVSIGRSTTSTIAGRARSIRVLWRPRRETRNDNRDRRGRWRRSNILWNRIPLLISCVWSHAVTIYPKQFGRYDQAPMSILYLLTAPPPPIEGTDAVFQEVAALCAALQGETINLCPVKSSTRRFPKQLYGFHKIRQFKDLEKRCKINHIFFSFPYPFPILRLLRNPVFYTVTASLDVNKRPPACARLQKLQRIIVSNERDAAVLKAWGLSNYAIVPPGIDTAALARTILPLDRELTLLMASAPWHMRQFDSKGIDLLLAAATNLPFLRLILIWRGVLADELARRVERLGLGKRVEIINRKVNVGEYLTKAHATIVLANNGGLVKSFPHSLVESLVAGKPVLLSDTIAMADYVRSRQCGIVVAPMNIEALMSAIERLMRSYDQLARNATQIDRSVFSIDTMVDNYRRLYGL
jgi:glycosyltransferase involved in cell wall biosynthesis